MSTYQNTKKCECAACSGVLPAQARTDKIRIAGLDCADCAVKLEKKLGSSPGVISANINFGTGMLTIKHAGDIDQIISIVKGSGYTIARDCSVKVDSFEIEGLDCADCASKLEKYVAGMPGVMRASLNFASAVMTVEHSCGMEEIGRAISGMGYSFRVLSNGRSSTSLFEKNRKAICTLVSGAGLLSGLLSAYLGLPWALTVLLYTIAIAVGGFYVARSALYSIRTLTPDMNLLMTVAVTGAIAIGQWEEAAAVVFLFSLGSALQSYTLDKTRDSIKSLMSLSPKEASVLKDGKECRVSVGSIDTGDILLIRPGERIAMDGVVLSGSSTVNQASITGEPIPVEKVGGSTVYAGTLNERGTLEVRVTRRVEDSTLSKIMHMIEEAQSNKAPAQELVDRFARYYTPAVISGAVALAVLPALVFSQPFSVWLYRALVLLVIACPCALIISTPVSIVAAIGSASRHGVLIKGGSYLEACSKVKAIAFDKTGTLTEGKPRVTDIVTYDGIPEKDALRIAAAIESRSEHPLASAILKASGNAALPKIEHFESITGAGVRATIDGTEYYIGNGKMFRSIPRDVQCHLDAFQGDGKIPVMLGCQDRIMAVIAIADEVRADSRRVVDDLHKAGVHEVVMLTGDSERTANAIAGKTGVDRYYAGLLPRDKVTLINAIKKKHHVVAMVGDGINDAPALAASDVSIAMGATGSDTAIETADIALMSNDLTRLEYVIRLGRRTMNIIKQNITLSVVIKFVFIALALLGMANLWMALFADTGAAILVILNGMRLLQD